MTASGQGNGESRWLAREARAWQDLALPNYDRAICDLLDEIRSGGSPVERTEATLALASAALRRGESSREGYPVLIGSRACSAEHLLAVVPIATAPGQAARIGLLFLLAWLQLGAVAAQGPESINTSPDLPPGVVLPTGADPAAITDPVLRGQAEAAVERHKQEAAQWNAKQAALGHLRHLASLLRAAGDSSGSGPDLRRELAAAMALAPGVPDDLRALLREMTAS